jgi:hypothetical protein
MLHLMMLESAWPTGTELKALLLDVNQLTSDTEAVTHTVLPVIFVTFTF